MSLFSTHGRVSGPISLRDPKSRIFYGKLVFHATFDVTGPEA